tara:strand:- start:162 stop:1091 length:930 start_codon:yes stop_codon:yes gene_type:complete
MKTDKISELFDGGGLIINKSKNTKIFDFQYDEIVKLFEKYGIIIFRGFEFGPKELTKFTDIYTELYSGDALRRKIRFDDKKIRNVDYGFSRVDLHSEASFTPSWPELIWFYCNVPPVDGGETILCDGIKLWDSLDVDTKGFFLSEQIYYKLKIPVIRKRDNANKKPWLMPIVGAGKGFITNNDGCLNLVQKRYAVQESRIQSKLAFANHLFIHLNSEPQLLSRGLSNKRQIPDFIFDEINNKAKLYTYKHIWEKKDFIMLDNKRFLHGRESLIKDDPRDIVVIQSQRASFAYGVTTRNNLSSGNQLQSK